MNSSVVAEFVRDLYQTQEFIPLHAPCFEGNEKAYLNEVVDSTFVSSVGKYVDRMEKQLESFTGASRAVATVNGTAALHAALYLSGVRSGDLVITQALTFVATCNALHHMGAEPIFVDVSPTSMGLCPDALEEFLSNEAELRNSGCVLRSCGRRIKAVVPMHTFGHPVQLEELISVCQKWHLDLIEDAAESLGSFYKEQHTGTFSDFSALSFNGNKIITTGGGGMILCRSSELGDRAKHLTTTAKIPHPYEFFHDESGFNYRMPNINAALGCAQMEVLERHLSKKRALASEYEAFFDGSDYKFVREPQYAKSNYWLNAVTCENKEARDDLLKYTNDSGVMTRPVWQLMHRLPMYAHCARDDLQTSELLEGVLVNIPSSPIRGLNG